VSTRSHLEAAIAAAEAESYQQIPQPSPGISNQMMLTEPFADIVYAILLVGLFVLMGLAIGGLKVVASLRSHIRSVEK